MDRSDISRKAYLAAVIEAMKDPAEEKRIRLLAADLLARKIEGKLIGDAHARRWRQLLGLPRDELARILLDDSEYGREMRHAHLFAGCIPAATANLVCKIALEGAKMAR